MKYAVTGDAKRGYAVKEKTGAIVYDLIEWREEAIAIRNALNAGVAPDWESIAKAIGVQP